MKSILILFFLTHTSIYAQKTLYDFGVRGDGSDETKTIQKAINESSGKTLIIPRDTFLCKDIYWISKIKVIGEDGAFIKLHSSRMDGKEGITIENIIFEGYKTFANSTTLLQIQSCKNIVINKCTLKDNFAEAIALNNSRNCKISKNTILRTDVGVLTNGNCSDLEIVYNYIDGGTSDGVAIYGKEGTIDSNIVVHTNKVYNKTQGHGYLNWWASNVEYKSNYAENCSHGFGTQETTYSPSFLKVINNTFRRCGVGIDAAINNSVITGNIIDSTKSYGMWVGSQIQNSSNTYNVVVSKNVITNTTDGIRIVLAKKSVISGNIVTDTRTKKITYAGVTIIGGENNSVINNVCGDATFPFHVNKALNTSLSGNLGSILNQGTGTIQIIPPDKILSLTRPTAPVFASTFHYALYTANGAVTNTGITTIKGDIGVNEGLITGYDHLKVAGALHSPPDGSTAICAADLLNMYSHLDNLTPNIKLTNQLKLGDNLVLTPQTYFINSAAALTNTLYLDAQNNANTIFVIKVNGALSASANAKVILANGAHEDKVFWLVNGSVNLNSHAVFKGTIVCSGAININIGTLLTGRVLTTNGALNTTAITAAIPALSSAGRVFYTWIGGSVDGDWNKPSNWSTKSSIRIPTGCEADVIIPSGSLIISTAVSAGNVSISPDAHLYILGSLSICGNLIVSKSLPLTISQE